MKKNNKVRNLIFCSLVSALLCIFAPISIPIGVVPVTLANFVIYLSVVIVGLKTSFVSLLVYLLLGIAGLPVFSAYSGGIGKLLGPTGGYLIGYIPMVLIAGGLNEKRFLFGRSSYVQGKENEFSTQAKERTLLSNAITIIGMLVGTFVQYLMGTFWFCMQMECDVKYAVSVCVLPFIAFDIGKMIVAFFLGRTVRKILVRQEMVSN